MNFEISGLRLNSVLLFTLLACFGCSKSSNSKVNVIVPPPTDTTTTYKDPAQYGTPYSEVPASKDIIMYEVNMKTYTPANFAGVSARLDSIKALGINVIWLMPTYPVGTDAKSINSPYCVKDFEGVNASFGTLTDLRNLVAAAHARGMAVIFDWVADHTSWDNAWIVNKAWYQQDAAGNIIPPAGTNYSDVAGLNYSNTQMRTAMIRAMKYWVFAANIDGYRCDFADNIPADFWTQALDTLGNIKTHKLIYLAEGTKSAEITAGFQLDYAFSYYSTLKGVFGGSQSVGAIFTTNTNELASLPSPGLKLRYITNHDDASADGSVLNIYNSKQGSLAAFVMAAYMDGVPLIYDSQEVAYPNPISIFTNVPVDYTANPDLVAAYKQIIAFRTAHEAVKTGTMTIYNDENIIAFEKKSGADDVLIMVNAKNSIQTYIVPAVLQGTTWTDGIAKTSITLNATYTFQPYSYLALSK